MNTAPPIPSRAPRLPACVWPLLTLAAWAAALGLAAANLWLGDLNQDEGWYLYAARMVTHGCLPYRDFAFTQGPVMPLVYAAFEPLVRVAGLAGGRLATAVLGLAAAALAARLARRLAPNGTRAAAALAAFALAAVNVYQSYFFTVVKTYALTALLLLAGFLLLAHGWRRARAWPWLLAGACLALAAATRSSAGIVLPIVVAGLWVARRRQAPPRAWWLTGLGAAAAGALVVLPFLVMAPRAFLFFVVGFHTLRDGGSGALALAYKLGFCSRLVQAYFVAIAVGLGAAIAAVARRATAAPGSAARAPDPAAAILQPLAWLSGAAVTLVHLMAPFPYDDYQAFIMPLLAAVLAAVLAATAARLAGERAAAWVAAGVLLLSMAASVSSPLNQDWFIQGRDRIWWRVKDRSPLAALRDVAARIRRETRPGDVLLTQDPYLAVESGRRLPPGLEMGQFSYFPDLTDATAETLHVLNRAGFERLLRTTEAPMAALSGYALAIAAPAVVPVSAADTARFRAILRERFDLADRIPRFGQAYTTLELYRRRSAATAPASP